MDSTETSTTSTAVTAARIFISYGRHDAGELANQLAGDLKSLGHTVWLDTAKIRAGTSWQDEIVEGLHNAEIVIALMSPRSVRTSRSAKNTGEDDSICLGEIAYAVSQRRKVIPVMAVQCDAPLMIYHLDYVDLTQSASPSLYKAGFDRLLEFIAAARTGNWPQYRSWYHDLEPWNFAPFLYEKRKNFTGREWLFDEIEQWRRSGAGKQVLLITGDPGVGKSAIVAQLVYDNSGGQVIAYHCCQSDTKATLEPWRFVRSIAAMLASRLPDFARQLELPSIRSILSESSCREDPASAFEQGILSCLQTMPAPEQGARYILVDALDEASEAVGEMSIVELLRDRIERLPDWLRIVATTRKEPAVLRMLKGLNPRELSAEDPKNIDDLQRYIQHRLADPSLAAEIERVAQSSRPCISPDELRHRATQAILASSKGNFLYVRYALDEIESPTSDERTFSLDRLDNLPMGLTGMYDRFFHRHFGSQNRQFSDVKPILEVVCAGREPLEERELTAAAGCRDKDEFRRRWRMIAQYVPERTKSSGEAMFVPFHKSLTDWLTSDKTRREGDFGIGIEDGDRKLADWCWQSFERRPAVPPDRYWVRHGATHLFRAFECLHGSDQFDDESVRAKCEYVVQVIEFLGWLDEFPETIAIVDAALPQLSVTLANTNRDLDFRGLSKIVLEVLENVDQQSLFDLVKGCCATDIAELVIKWIGRTQKAGWGDLVPQILALNEYVIRYAAGCGQAVRYARMVEDGEESDAAREIDELLASSDTNALEMGAYAVGEIAKTLFMSRMRTKRHPSSLERVRKWLTQISSNDLYFCQSVLGDLLINLSLADKHSIVADLHASNIIPGFWKPLWEYTRLDVISVLALRQVRLGSAGETTFHDPVGSELFRCEVEREAFAIRERERRIDVLAREAGDLGPELARILRQTEVMDSDNETIIRWLKRDGLDARDPDIRIRTAAEFLQLLFRHSLWRMCEKGSAVLPQLGGESEWRDVSFQILDRLLDSLDPCRNDSDPGNWRVVLGTSEACALIRHLDTGRDFGDGRRIQRMEYCWHQFHGHFNCHVRALLAEGYFFIVGDEELGRSNWETGRALEYLKSQTVAIDRWMVDDDIWVLEHVYQFFLVAEEKQQVDEDLRAWTHLRLATVDANPDCLLAQVSKLAGQRWLDLERADFLKSLHRIRIQRV